MIAILLVCGAYGGAFGFIEYLQRSVGLNRELTRKLSHVIGAGGSALLPFWVTLNDVAVVAAVFVLVMLYSKRFRIFESIHRVRRRTYGEIYMPLGILLAALLAPDHLIFAIAMLVLALADTAAELAGSTIRSKKLLHGKSIAGTAAFFVVAFTVCLSVLLITDGDAASSAYASVAVASGASMAELVSRDGADNLTIPLVVIAMLTPLLN